MYLFPQPASRPDEPLSHNICGKHGCRQFLVHTCTPLRKLWSQAGTVLAHDPAQLMLQGPQSQHQIQFRGTGLYLLDLENVGNYERKMSPAADLNLWATFRFHIFFYCVLNISKTDIQKSMKTKDYIFIIEVLFFKRNQELK